MINELLRTTLLYVQKHPDQGHTTEPLVSMLRRAKNNGIQTVGNFSGWEVHVNPIVVHAFQGSPRTLLVHTPQGWDWMFGPINGLDKSLDDAADRRLTLSVGSSLQAMERIERGPLYIECGYATDRKCTSSPQMAVLHFLLRIKDSRSITTKQLQKADAEWVLLEKLPRTALLDRMRRHLEHHG